MGFLSAMAEGIGACAATIWALQERRFSTVFDAASSAARLLISSVLFCLIIGEVMITPRIAQT